MYEVHNVKTSYGLAREVLAGTQVFVNSCQVLQAAWPRQLGDFAEPGQYSVFIPDH
jgi:hypothetical protein